MHREFILQAEYLWGRDRGGHNTEQTSAPIVKGGKRPSEQRVFGTTDWFIHENFDGGRTDRGGEEKQTTQAIE